MVGSKYWKTGLWIALGSAALLVFGAADVRAELLSISISPEAVFQTHAGLAGAGTQEKSAVGFVACGSAQRPTVSPLREDGRAVWQGLRNEWESLRQEMAMTAMTMFFIRGGTPPPTLPGDPGSNTGPPGQSNTPPGGNGNLPPPGGQGEGPPGDPGNPPVGTPEPASFVMALLGAGLAAGYRWRQQRRSSVPAV